MTSTDMAIVRLLTDGPKTIDEIWEQVKPYGETITYLWLVIEDWESQGYVARLDDGYCLTR